MLYLGIVPRNPFFHPKNIRPIKNERRTSLRNDHSNLDGDMEKRTDVTRRCFIKMSTIAVVCISLTVPYIRD